MAACASYFVHLRTTWLQCSESHSKEPLAHRLRFNWLAHRQMKLRIREQKHASSAACMSKPCRGIS
eukprot:3189070-Pleurochrysis_carterae.AAC.1